MSRTKGSGWVGGVMLYQTCPKCKAKKLIYDPVNYTNNDRFRCLKCKQRSDNIMLIRSKY